jgi:hypothetical protein
MRAADVADTGVLPPPEGEDFLDLVDLVCCQRLKPRLGVESVEVAALR